MSEAVLMMKEEVPLNKLRELMREVAAEAIRNSEKADKLLREKIIKEINQLSNISHD
jgi:ethanolamine utilization cobalamin adenosyltransferase